jgi:peptidoglycan/LPS O-acetylase OafA/YrhL
MVDAVLSRMPTLAERYSGQSNAFGTLRLTLAVWVLVSHAWPLGYARQGFGPALTRGQADLGTMALYGFFVLSGFLVAASGLRSTWSRFAWYRSMRIFPGLWVCLLVTAFVFAPLAAYIENGDLDGFWSHPQGPLEFLRVNWFGSMEQYPISGLLADTPFGHVMGGPSAFTGSMWTLHYEYACYAGVAILAATSVLRRAPRVILLLAGCGFCLILFDLVTSDTWAIRPPARGAIGPFPLVGSYAWNWTLYLGFLFLLGVVARLYMHRLPMHGALALVAIGVMAISMALGGWVAFGLPAWGYVLLYLAVALPKRLRGTGRVLDYSYGMYIYAFPVQQLFALVGFTRYGLVAYIVLTIACTLPLAMLSWHFIERPALRLKDVDPSRWRWWPRPPRPADTAQVPPDAVAEPQLAAPSTAASTLTTQSTTTSLPGG